MANSYLFMCFARSRVSGTNVRKRSTNFPREDIAGIRSIGGGGGGEGKDKHNSFNHTFWEVEDVGNKRLPRKCSTNFPLEEIAKIRSIECNFESREKNTTNNNLANPTTATAFENRLRVVSNFRW